MVWGRKTNGSRASSGQGISGHLDEWARLAVDYVDGTVDDSTRSAIQAHLQTCPDCARRLTAQQSALAYFAQAPLVEAPERSAPRRPLQRLGPERDGVPLAGPGLC
jgi:anti-sigma factor RsiW